MIRMLVVALAATGLLITGCSQEQPAQPKPSAKPAVEPATPVVPATPAPPVVAPEPAKPAVPPAATPKVAEPVPAPVKPAEPTAPATPVKPAVKIPTVPDTLTLAASQGKVTLSHLVHAKLFPCATCHGDGTPGKINLDKEAAHALCRDCHKAKGTGPTACGECHKK